MPDAPNTTLLQQAITLHQAGSFDAAKLLYQRLIETDPFHAEGLHLLGILAQQQQQFHESINLIQRALHADPNNADAYCNLGNALHACQRLAEANAAYQQSLSLKPEQPGVLSNLSGIYRLEGKLDEAKALAEKALAIAPDCAEGWCSLSNIYSDQQQLEPALAALKKALAIDPNNPEFLNNLGILCKERGEYPAAERHYQKALSFQPNNPLFLNNYGVLLKALGELEIAANIFKKVVQLAPDFYIAATNLADALFELGMFKHSSQHYREVIAANPSMAEAHFGLAFNLLICGEFQQGWQEYCWRDLSAHLTPYRKCYPNTPRWQGESLQGKSIVILSEQGFGDTLQFCRLVNLITTRCDRVFLTAPPQLHRLLQSIPNTSGVYTTYNELPPHDYYCPLLHLPAVLGISETTIPATTPYLSVNESSKQEWRQRIPQTGNKRIGLVWAGSPKNLSNHKRSMQAAELAPLLALQHIDFYSLQVGAPVESSFSGKITDLSPYLSDFSQTAAAIEQLDLVITVCTSVAHLAAALNKPVWILLAHIADWRWLLDRSDSPWYPSARLFRQPERGDWPAVICSVIEALDAK